jgi:hypothetical protein
MTPPDPAFTLDPRPHAELCPCGQKEHRHGPVTPEHVARYAVTDVARYAVTDVARYAVTDVARYAVTDVARDVATDVARDAAWDAARYAAWCRYLATKLIGSHKTALADDHKGCAKEFPGFVLARKGK